LVFGKDKMASWELRNKRKIFDWIKKKNFHGSQVSLSDRYSMYCKVNPKGYF
jgi:hypothetical protein